MYRTVDTKVWDDPWFAPLPWGAKMLFLYLVLHPALDAGAKLELHHTRIPFDTGLSEEEIHAHLGSLQPFVSWYSEGPGIYITVRNYRKFVGDPGRLPADEWAKLRKAVFERDNYTCRYCGARGVRLECDHVIPISRGGSNDMDNLATACLPCNRSKRDKMLSEWLGGDVSNG
jgi:5-methylcytosine-specific restriction endonuclease McrA